MLIGPFYTLSVNLPWNNLPKDHYYTQTWSFVYAWFIVLFVCVSLHSIYMIIRNKMLSQPNLPTPKGVIDSVSAVWSKVMLLIKSKHDFAYWDRTACLSCLATLTNITIWLNYIKYSVPSIFPFDHGFCLVCICKGQVKLRFTSAFNRLKFLSFFLSISLRHSKSGSK